MRKQLILASLVLFSLVIISSCKSPEQKQTEIIKSLEKDFFDNMSAKIDRDRAFNLINAYLDFANEFPESQLAAGYMFRAGDLSMNVGYPTRALEIFTQIRSKYPDFEKAPESLFLIAFIYETQLNNLEKAGEMYKLFIELYPNHDFAEDAAIILNHLGKSPEDLIREFELLNQQQES